MAKVYSARVWDQQQGAHVITHQKWIIGAICMMPACQPVLETAEEVPDHTVDDRGCYDANVLCGNQV